MKALIVGEEGHAAALVERLGQLGTVAERVSLENLPAALRDGSVEQIVLAFGEDHEAVERAAARIAELREEVPLPLVLVWWPLSHEVRLPRLDGLSHDFLLGRLEEDRFQVRAELARQRAAEMQQLRRAESAFRSLMRGVPDGVVVCAERTIRYANEAAAHLFEVQRPEQLVGMDTRELLFSEQEVTRCREAEPDEPIELRVRGLRGTVRHVEMRRQQVSYEGREAQLLVLQDVARRKEAETRRLLTDRLAAVGTLAAGVAHELNNPLAFVSSNIRLLAERIAEAPGGMVDVEDLRDLVEEARVGLERMQRIVRDMRVLSRGDDGEPPSPVDVRLVLESALGMCRSELVARGIAVERRYEDGAPYVAAQEARLAQVFLNLLVNAIQALPEQDPERQRIVLEVRSEPSGWVVVAVEDSGCGIPPEVMPRIFDPFFTTKGPGEGTGLGLPICRSIVGSFGGDIHVESQPGHGTRFEVRLPSVEPARREAVLQPRRRGSAATTVRINRVSSGRALRVLVVEDEPMMLRTLKRWLGGWDVTVAAGAQEALGCLERDERYDVVLCDVMMPGMDGVAFYEAVRERWPRLAPRIVFMTGGAFTDRARRFFERVDNERVDKPFDPPALRELIRLVALGLRD